MPHAIQVKTILNKTKRRDPWFLDDYTVNPYSACSFNCLYCYIRGSKYGINMEEKVSVKENAVELLDKQLRNRAKKGQYGIIVLSSATDPYLHFEKDLQLTSQILEIILVHRFPVHIITKSDLVVRDLEILKKINEAAILPADLQDKLKHKVFVTFSFSTIDDKIAAIFEPGATAPSTRLKTLLQVADSGLYTGVSMMPLLPFITDTATHLEELFAAFKNHKANYIFPASIALFGNETADSKTLVLRAVDKYYPDLLEKYRKFFDNSNQMPAYYQKAFQAKMQEMLVKYQFRNSLF